MKKNYAFPAMLLGIIVLLAATKPFEKNGSFGLTKGTPAIKSISALSFGKNGILFIGDSKGAAVFAVDTKDSKNNNSAKPISINNIDQKIAAALGTAKENITITDIAVNPNSKNLYVAVQNTDGTPVLLMLSNDKIEAVSLKDVNFSTVALNNVVAEDAKDARGRSLRISTISDMSFVNGKLYISGLSNKEFSSTFRSIPFPFTDAQDQASLEIYHAAHGKYETTSPIRTFTIDKINGTDYLIASYTCTPLVLFPLNELKAGAYVKGRTVAEMGNGNTPIDMITVKNGSENQLVMANTARAVTKVSYKNIESFAGTLTERVSGTAGTQFELLSTLIGVVQMDKLDDKHLVVIQKQNSDINLLTVANN